MPDKSNRSSCLLGDIILSNLLKKDPEKSSVPRVESFINEHKIKFWIHISWSDHVKTKKLFSSL